MRAKIIIHSSTERVKIGKRTELRAAYRRAFSARRHSLRRWRPDGPVVPPIGGRIPLQPAATAAAWTD